MPMTNEFAVVAETYTVEMVVGSPALARVAEHREAPLPWSQIRLGALIGGLFGLLATATVAGIDSLPAAIACGIDIAAAGAIIGGLWGATFFAVDEH
jgi:hypothetical protein